MYANCDLKAVAESACCAEPAIWLFRPGLACAVARRTCLARQLTASGRRSRQHGASRRSCL